MREAGHIIGATHGRRWGRLAGGVLVAGLMAVSLPAHAARDIARSSNYYENALQLLEKDEFQGAIIELKNALQQDSENVAARILLGRLQLMLGDGKSAEEAFERALKSGADEALLIVSLSRAMLSQRKYSEVLARVTNSNRPADIEAQLLAIRGDALAEMRRLDDADAAFASAERMDPDLAAATLGRAKVALLRGNLAGSFELASAAVAKDNTTPDAWYFRGDINRVSGKNDAALIDFDKAVEIQPGHLRARLARATLLVETGRWDRAKEDVDFIRQLDPRDPFAAILAARIFDNAGNATKSREALAEAETIIRNMDPAFLRTDPPSLLAGALTANALKKYDDAANFLNQYLKLNNHHAGARKLLGQILIRQNSLARALEILRPAALVTPDDPQLLSMLGSTMVRLGRYDEGLRFLERAVELTPNSGWTRIQRAMGRIAAGESEGGIADLQSAVELDPEALEPRYMLAMQHLKQQRFADALKSAEELSTLTPDNPAAFNLVGAAKIGLGDNPGAKQAFLKALELAPDFNDARYNLSQIAVGEGDVAGGEKALLDVLARNSKETRAMRELATLAERTGRVNDAIVWLEKVRNLEASDIASQARLVQLYLKVGKADNAYYLADNLYRFNPNNPDVIEVLGKSHMALGRKPKAIELFRTMADLVRESGPKLYYVSELLLSAGDEATALSILEKSVRTDPNYVPAQIAFISLLGKQDQFDEAISRLQILETEKPDLVLGLLKGDTFMRVKRYDEAVTAYQSALKRRPDDGELVLRLFTARRDAKQYSAGVKELKAWLDGHPHSSDLRLAYASGLIDIGDVDGALAEHQALEAARPTDPRVLNNLAWLYHEKGDARALDYARRAHEAAPEPSQTNDTLGWILVQSGQPEKGLPYLRTAYVRDSRNPDIRYHLAVALNKLGRDGEARRELEEVVRLMPESAAAAKARTLLAQLPARSGAPAPAPTR